ncbi:casein kinase I isoform delta [Purpureocillium lilacinum]|uniref:non-specific serine/threonine protein kinase n=1 Tax=Purpureocillium lilacinum TaxID=33203 RepID=A0A179GA40_PURLI|nr:casein kinase I isoform delta [Purpureocillium lilacinum]OAQ74388.1 casein kinase I isoform delta [Purpureocillium lilacinum]
MKPIIVNGRYQVKSKLGEGGFGLVYDGDDILSNEEVAIKLVHRRDDPRILEDEASIYRALAGGPGIPQVFWYGQQDDYYVLVQELLGPSLEDLFNFCGRRFSLKTVLLVADQAISRIKYIHDKHYLHHDIKPDNFLMGVGRRGNVLYTIDFGLAQEFSGLASEGRSHGRTLRYASINNHNKRKQSWCDDLESLGYVLLYFIRGSLPWQGCKAASEEEKDDLIKDMKTNSSPRSLCEGLPEEFATYLGYVRSLGFEDRPDYAYLHRLFNRLFVSLEFKHDNVFDWTEKRFNELHGLVAAS